MGTRKLGSYYEIDDDWRRDCVAELKRRSMTRKALAAAISTPDDPIHPSSITLLFRMTGDTTSRIAKRVADYLGG